MPEAATHLSPEDAATRLWNLAGLKREDLLEAVMAAVAAVGSCTENDPPTARGYDVWRSALRRLREILRPQGWKKDDTGNFSTVVNHSTRTRIAVVNTDDATGNPSCYPVNRSRKGANSHRASRVNQRALPFPDWVQTEPDDAMIPGYATWYLCIYIEQKVVRAELSLPTRLDNGFFADWNERIMLVSAEDEWADGITPEGDDEGPVFEVPVSRK